MFGEASVPGQLYNSPENSSRQDPLEFISCISEKKNIIQKVLLKIIRLLTFSYTTESVLI